MTPEVATLALRDLEYIVAIAEHQNFRLAAQSCAVSQPALSGQIKKVETALDIQIFERTNREVLVTTIGEQIVEQARVILEELEVLGSIARGADRPLSGPFRLGISSSICQYLLPYLSAPLKEDYPDLELVIREATQAELIESLRIGRLDALVVSTSDEKTTGKLRSTLLYQEPLVLAVHDENLTYRSKELSIEDFSLDHLVMLDETHSLTQVTQNLFGSAEIDLTTHPLYTTSIESMLLMVVNTNRLAITPLLASKAERALKGISFLNLKPPVPYRDISLVWRPRYPGGKALNVLSSKIRTYLKSQKLGIEFPEEKD